MRRVKHNDLLPWILEDHGKLPAGYLKSVEKFLISYKLQATSHKLGWARPIMYKGTRKIIKNNS